MDHGLFTIKLMIFLLMFQESFTKSLQNTFNEGMKIAESGVGMIFILYEKN